MPATPDSEAMNIVLVHGAWADGSGWIQAICTLLTIVLVHSDNQTAGSARIALGLFSTAIAVCILLLLSHDRPFTGQLSVKPAALLQVEPEP
jgi:uncharacterized membrane protein